MSRLEDLRSELDRMVNAQFETPEFQRFLSIRYTMERARFLALQMSLYVQNRRDCWGYVQGAAPLDVKRLVWQHEGEELARDPRCDTDHYTLQLKECQMLGISAGEIANVTPPPQLRAAQYAWLYLAVKSQWLGAFASISILERRNNNEIVKGGGLSLRIAKKWREELGLAAMDMPSVDVHTSADKEHSDMMWEVYQKYAANEEGYAIALQGARESLEIDRAYRLGLAVAMEGLQ